MACVTVLPTQPPRTGLGFDFHSFEKRSRAVSAATQISFADYQHMHVTRRASQRYKGYIPTFAANDQQLRRVLTVAAWQYCHGRKTMPSGLQVADLQQMTAERFKVWESCRLNNFSVAQRRIVERHIFATRYAGGWLALHATVAYLSWRLGYPSPQIAEQLWMTAAGVRITLYRLTKIARSLGYATFKPGDWMSRANVRRRGRNHS